MIKDGGKNAGKRQTDEADVQHDPLGGGAAGFLLLCLLFCAVGEVVLPVGKTLFAEGEQAQQGVSQKLDAVEIACLRDLGQDPETQIEHRGEEKAVADILHQMGGSGSAVFGLKGDAEQGDD